MHLEKVCSKWGMCTTLTYKNKTVFMSDKQKVLRLKPMFQSISKVYEIKNCLQLGKP
jgi:hypothetical protein